MRVLSPRDACLFIRLSVPLSTVCRKPHARRHEKHPKSGSIPVTFSLVLQESIKGMFSADDRGRGGRKHCSPRAVARCGSVAANILEMIGWSDRLGQGRRMLFLKSALATAVLLLSLPAVEASSVPAYHFTGDVFFNFKGHALQPGFGQKSRRTCTAAGFRSRDVARSDLKDLSPVVGGDAGP
jgi:hypothetical protein